MSGLANGVVIEALQKVVTDVGRAQYSTACVAFTDKVVFNTGAPSTMKNNQIEIIGFVNWVAVNRELLMHARAGPGSFVMYILSSYNSI